MRLGERKKKCKIYIVVYGIMVVLGGGRGRL